MTELFSADDGGHRPAAHVDHGGTITPPPVPRGAEKPSGELRAALVGLLAEAMAIGDCHTEESWASATASVTRPWLSRARDAADAILAAGWRPGTCDGSGTCAAVEHIHGCFRSAPEPDVEYGCRRAYDEFVFGPFSKTDAMNFQSGFDVAAIGSKLVQRTAPGPWTAVTE